MLGLLSLAAMLGQTSATPPALPFVSPLFSDNMVLQRGMADPVWGWATPGANVTVTIDGKTYKTTAGREGKWMTKVGPLKVGGPYTMSVAGPSSATFSNILVGDVWICSGQSNMEFGVGNLLDPQTVINGANYPNIRLCAIPRLVAASPVESVASDWKVCTPDNLAHDGIWGGFSAVGYFFGRQLNEDLKIPIGLIHTSWGGTPAEAWTGEQALGAKLPEFQPALKDIALYREMLAKSGVQGIDQLFDAWYVKNDNGTNGATPWFTATLDDSDWKTMQLPGYFQRAGIPELVNNQSVVWFRRDVDLPDDIASKEATMRFVADDNDTTWINGTQVGRFDGPTTARAYKIPAGLLKPGKNQITIRVTDTGQPGGVYGQPDSFVLDTGGATIPLSGTWKVKLGAAVGRDNPMPQSFGDDPNAPTVLFNGMIYPLAPFGIKGAIWYQGESNGGRGYQYRTLLPTMITSWRDTFGQGAFPFLIVQLAGWGHPPQQPGDDGWAEVREAQFLTAKNLANTGIATAVDIGEEADIHPKDKQDVGKRLALVAESKFYKRRVASSGPVYKSMKVEGSSIRLSFDHTDGGLVAKGGSPKTFAIAGEDHKWYWADAKIEGASIVVSSPQAPHPVAVRYSWAMFLESNVYNGAGLPAFPFRTDDWKVSSEK